ncbi:MAG: hypothetical protein HFE72_12960 [Emergencia sp.]|uniref:hypothetical protein n=1 Tax=Senimuribacter intestinalis TaxID=2941507 RepID=UPI00203D76BD|nr:hypothetical protein [Senimuribacter intestinalis]MCI9641013.1 hypothetical protein [Emergencia sp.]
MDRNFALLGLREDATKEQVKAAYAKRLTKYKSADYEDDPEYVRRKIAELNEAYARAYQRAGGSPGGTDLSERTLTRMREADEDKAQRDRRKAKEPQYEKRRQEMEGEEFHPLQKLRLEREEVNSNSSEKREFKTPDLSAFKTKAEEFRDSIKENLKENFGEANASQEDATQPPSLGDAAARSQNSSGHAEGNFDGSGLKVIAGILLIIAVSLFSMCDGSDTNYYDDNWDTVYSTSDYSDEDWEVQSIAESVRSVIFYDLEITDDIVEVDDDEERLQKAADKFAERYTDYSTIADLCRNLYGRVDSFYVSDSDDIFSQVEAVLEYYQFPSVNEVIGYINPYTGKSIKNRTGYLLYLNRYYKEEQES